MDNILVVVPVLEHHKGILEAKAPKAAFTYCEQPDKEMVQAADIIIGNAAPDMIKGSERLKWIQLSTAGANGYTEEVLKNAVLTSATGAYGLALAEHMLASLMMLQKKLHLYYGHQQKHEWIDEGSVTSIYGSKSLVVGMGDIGSEFAMRMNALGSQVTGIRRNKTEKPDYLTALYQMDSFESLLGEMDIVTTSLPGTKDTYQLFNAETFKKMKKGSYFINIGRGTTVDSMALAEALNSGHLAGAAIDVTDPEPLPADHPLWDAKNLVITPHVSGYFHLQETWERVIRIAADNLDAFLRGAELKNVIDFATGYRQFIR